MMEWRWLRILRAPCLFRYQRKDDGEKFTLTIRKCRLEDAGVYSFEIQQYVKDGEPDQIDCWLDVEGETLNPRIIGFLKSLLQ